MSGSIAKRLVPEVDSENKALKYLEDLSGDRTLQVLRVCVRSQEPVLFKSLREIIGIANDDVWGQESLRTILDRLVEKGLLIVVSKTTPGEYYDRTWLGTEVLKIVNGAVGEIQTALVNHRNEMRSQAADDLLSPYTDPEDLLLIALAAKEKAASIRGQPSN